MKTLTSYRLLFILMTVAGQLFLGVAPAKADPYPPYWQSGSGPSIHFQPEAWPDEPADPTQCGMECGEWIPYTRYAFSINDARTQDPSSGGTSPQNYVNIASSCVDETYPSIYYHLDLANEVLMFRWRVEQIANTYATGPSAGSYSSSDPWSSALWTVFFDLNGDGYRDLAAHLDGSSGSPATPIDRLIGIWADVPNSQSLDYLDDPNIYDLAHNPTGFVYSPTNKILNFHSTVASPDDNWPSGAAETIWNYGPSRSKVVTLHGVDGATCNEYFVDYQIPLSLVDASAFGGPKIDQTTPFAMLFCTANSLNDPFQKDCAYQGDWIGDPSKEGPFGDYISFDDGTIDQPIVTRVEASGCGPTQLAVNILDTIDLEDGDAETSVQEVDFYYYYDMNGDGEDNDGNSWTYAIAATNVAINRWTATWNSTGLLQGQYLVGVQAVDDGSKNDDGYANRVFSYLSQAEVDALGNDPASSGEEWYPNPDVTGVVATALFANACGVPEPFVSKTVEPSLVTTGETVTFTVAISNTHTDPLTVTVITDTLPPGFAYGDTVGGTLSPTTSPSVGVTDDITWTFSPAVAVAPGSADTLVFTATAPSTVGTYANLVSVETETNFGTLTSEPVQVGVGAPRLSIAKSASTLSASPGDTITYTITYGNDSTVNVTGAVITDVLPTGLNLVSILDGGSESGGTVTWNVGDIPSGEGPFTARLVVTVTNPYPDAAAVPLVNTATIDGNETDPANASSATFIDTPRPAFAIQKDADGILVSPGGRRVFTLTYANTGNATATNAVITDTMPDGFTFASASPGGVNSGSIVTWSIGSVDAGVTGWVTFTADADTPFASANPATNTVILDSTQTGLISDTYRVGVIEAGGVSVCEDYYFHDVQKTVGSIGTGRVASVTVPVDPAAILDYQFTGSSQEAIRFYSDPVLASALLFTEDVTGFWWINSISGGAGIENAVTELYDYDPSLGSLGSLLGSFSHPSYGTTSTPFTVPFTIPQPSLTVAAGHRLAIRFVADKQGGSNPTVQYAFDGASRDAHYSVCETVGSPLPVLNKQVSALIAEPGARLTYTIQFGNAGSADITGAVITDTLPSGVTFVSATLNGSSVTPGNPSPSVYTFTVNSSDTGTAGQITAGEFGTLLVMVDVDAPLADGIDALLNTVVLDGNEIAPITDTIPTAVLRPDLSISKAANDTLLVPGDTVTFTLTVLNSGYATATNVTISDTLPATTYFTYVVNSTRLNGTTPGSDPVSGDLMSFDIGDLGPGDSAQVIFQMYAHTSGVPAGVTDLGNTAAVTSTQTGKVSSEAVTVSISANPNLRLVKSLEPGGTLSPGDRITFTLVVSNVGASDAVNVQVRDPIPDDTAYVAGTLVYSGTAQTDVDDADEGRLDAAGNRVVFDVDDLPSGEGRTMQFTVLVDEPLPNGTTYFTNTATAGAGNAAAKSSTATAQATAAPNVTVSKTGADTLAYPAATLAADVSDMAAFQVDDSSQLEVGQYVRVNGYDARITAISGSTITVTAPITATSGTNVTGSIIFNIGYANEGTAVANNVVITDILPTQSAFITATIPHVRSGNTITWTVSSLDPDESSLVQVTVFLTGTGSFTNTAYTNSDETTPVSDTLTTSVGGLRVRKRTTTPVVTQTLTGTSATYVIEVRNTSASDAGGVIVTDTLAAGFTFSETLGITGGTRAPSTPDPSTGDAQPAWGTFTVTGNSTLYITFTVSISDVVGPATYQNEVLVTSSDTSVTPFDPLLAPDEDVRVQVPVVRLSKTVTPTTVWAGCPVTYTIVAYNIGEAAAQGVVITDSLPSGFAYASTVSTDDITATRTSVYATATPSWGVWDIAPSGKVTVTFVVTASTSTGTWSNTVLASSDSISIPTVSDTAPVTVTPLSDLSVTKVMSDAAPDVGSTVWFTVTVTNDGPSDATNVEVTDQLPSGYTFVSDNGGGDYDSGTGVWDVGTVSADGSATLLITATVNASGDYTNEAEVTAVGEDDPDSSPNDGSGDDYTSVTPTLNPVADLRVEKEVSDSTPDVGSQIVFTVTVTNDGPSDTTGVVVDDGLPAGYTLVATDTTEGSYAGGTWTVGGLANGASASLYLTVTVEAAGPYGNTASVTGSDEDDDDPANDSDTETPTPNPVADLSVTKVMSDIAPDVGSTVRFTVTVTNAGPSDATNVQVTDQLPSGYAYVSDDGGGSYNSVTGVWDVGTVSAGGSETLLITATVNASGDYTNEAEVTGVSEDDPDSSPNDGSGDDYASVTATPNPVADLQVSKSDSDDPVVAGETLTYTVMVENNGPSDATGVVVTDTLPGDVSYASHSLTIGSFDSGTGVWTVGVLSVGSSEMLTLVVDVDAGATGSLSNQADVAGDQADPTPGNDGVSESTEVGVEADISLVKTIDDITLGVGGTAVFTITASNAGPSDAVNVVITDVVDSRLRVEAVSANASYSGQEITASFATISVSGQETIVITATLLDLITVTEGTQITNAVFLDYQGNPSGPVGSNVVTGTIAEPSVTLDKSVQTEREPVGAGDVLTYTLVLRNEGSGPAYNVWVTDTLPSGLTYVATQQFSVTDPPAAVLTDTNTSGDTVLTWGISELSGAGFSSWQEQGIVFDPATNRAYYPSVLYDAAAFGDAMGDVISTSLPYTYQVTPYYKMWVATGGGAAGTQYAYSDDGTTWHEFNGGTALPGLFPSGYHGIVLYDPDEFEGTGYKYRVWYWDGTTNYTVTDIHTADSADGIVWENDQSLAQDAAAPIVTGGASDWNRGTHGPVWLFYNASGSSTLDDADVWNNKYVMYYDATTGGREDVGLGYSTDGVQWKRYGDDPVLPAGPTSWDSSYATFGTVVRGVNGTYRFWYSGGTTASHHGIGYASSRDGVHWTKSLDNPLFHIDDGVAYRDERTYTPIVLYSSSGFDGHGASAEYKMWFSCRAGGDYRICYADNTIGTSGVITITYTARVSDAIDADLVLSNAARGTYDSQPDDALDERSYSVPTAAVTTTTGQPAFELKKSTSVTLVHAGEQLTYTIAVTNTGLVSATNVFITDVVPPGTTLVTASLPHDGPDSSGVITWPLGTLNIGVSQAVTMVVRVPSSVSEGVVITNTAWVTGSGISTVKTGTVTTTVSTQADLSLDKTVNDATPDLGDTIIFTVTIDNAGPSDATGVVVSDSLPSGYTFVSYSASQGVYTDTTGEWNIDTIAAQTGVTLTIIATVNATGDYDNYAQIAASDVTDPDSTPGDDSLGDDDDDIQSASPNPADLSLTKVVDNPSPDVGSDISFTIAVTNSGPADATGVVISDMLSTGYTFVSYTASQGVYTATTGQWNVDTVAASTSVTLTIIATVNASGDYGNYAQVWASNQADPDSTPGDDSTTDDDDATQSPIPNLVADLSVSKVSQPRPAVPGETITYIINVVNIGPSALTAITLTDNLPTAILNELYTPSEGNYDSVAGTWTGLTFDAGDYITLTITGTLNSAFVGTLQNTVVVTSGQAIDPDPASNQDTDTNTTPPVIQAIKYDTLAIDADFDGVPSPGDTLSYTIVITNLGGSSATGVTFNDVPDTNTSLVVGSVTTSRGFVATGNVAGDIDVSVNVGSIPAGGDATVVFQVTIDDPLPAGVTIVANQGGVSSNELPDEPTDDPATGVEGDETVTPMTAEPALEAEKTDTLLVDADGDGEPSADDTLLYEVVIFNTGNIAATGVSFSDTLDPNTALVTGTVQTSLGTVTSGNNPDDVEVIVDVGPLPGGGMVEVSYQATIASPLPAGVSQIANQGFVSGDGLPIEPTDDPETPEDDDDTQTPIVICSVAPDVYEMDNLYTQAVEIPTDGTVQTRTFHVVADKDWASFHAFAGYVYTITTSQLGLDVDTVLQLYGSDGVTLINENDDYVSGSKASRIVWTALTDGQYYVRITHFDRTYDPRSSLVCGNHYLLAVEEEAICRVGSDVQEPDDLYPRAVSIPTDGTVQAHTFHVVADKDWASFYAYAGHVYTITTSQLGADVDTVLELYDTDGVTLLEENDDYQSGSNGSRIVWTAPDYGRYYIRITHFDRTYNPRSSLVCGNHYLLAVEEATICSVGPDVHEPDNLYPQAVEILANGPPQTHTFHVVADKDWASFYALAGHVYTVTTSQLGLDVDTMLELYDTDGVTLLDKNDDYLSGSNESRIVWTAPAEGRYYVRVTHFDRTYDPRQSLVCGNQYLTSVEATSCNVAPDIYESDNFYTQAPVIPTDGTVQTHTFHMPADKDWIKFFAWGGQIYTATTSRLSPDVDTVLQIYDADGVTLLLENDDYRLGSDASHLVWKAPADGWYFVRITHFDTTYDPRRSPFCGNQYRIAMRQQILDITKTAQIDRQALRPGDEILYTIIVTNLMNIPQTGIVITDAIPNYTTYVSGSASISQGSVSGPDPLVADIGTLLPGQRVVFPFRVALREDSQGQTIINKAVVASDQRVTPVSSPLISITVYHYLYLPIVIK